MKRLIAPNHSDHLIVFVAMGLSGCIGDDKGTGLGTYGGGSPDCLTATQATAGWSGDPDYQFEDYNFSCQGNPTSEEFYVISDTFNSGAGLSKASVMQDVADLQALWDNAAPGLTLSNAECNVLCTLGVDNDSVLAMAAATAPVIGEMGFAVRHRYSSGSVSCDITLYTNENNGALIPWSTGATPSSTEYSIRMVLMHEIGHCLGMEHPRNGSTLGTIMEVTPAGTAAPLTLDNDDAQAAAFVYP